MQSTNTLIIARQTNPLNQLMSYILHPYKQIFALFKTKFILLLQVVAAFLLPIQPLLIIVGLVILLDTVTGLIKAYKTKQPITSHKLSRVISKMCLYQICLISIHILDRFLLGELVMIFSSIPYLLTKIVAVFLVTVEGISIHENIRISYGVNLFKKFRETLLRVKEVKDDISGFTKTDTTGQGD